MTTLAGCAVRIAAAYVATFAGVDGVIPVLQRMGNDIINGIQRL